MLPIGSTFQTALAHLTNDERGRVLTFMLKFYDDPTHPSISLERVQHSKSSGLWSGRVSNELRAILQKDGAQWIALYVGHHDEAYAWASKHVVGKHPVTGTWQIVAIPAALPEPPVKTVAVRLFAKHADAYLLSLGVPELWLPVLRQISNEDELLDMVAQLPPDVGEILLDLVAGKVVVPPAPETPATDTRNLVVVKSKDDLRFLLDAPLAKWIAFLHPTQQRLAQGSFNGAVKVTGSAGTGKTVVALHRAKHLAAQGQRVLLTSFVQTLCRNLEHNLRLFCTPAELQYITVSTVHRQATELLKSAGEEWAPVGDETLAALLAEFAARASCPLEADSLFAEWQHVIQAQGLLTWEQYRSASRAGRGRALTLKDRKAVWEIIEQFQQYLLAQRQTSFSGLCLRAVTLLKAGALTSPYDAVVVDELQDLGAQELQMLAALAAPERLLLVGDGGQRIYAGKTSLKALGIDVRGRSHVLKLNYRTTEQIRRFADRLLDAASDDLDGGQELRTETRSLLSGPEPLLKGFTTRPEQNDFVVEQIQGLLKKGFQPDELAVFARQAKLLEPLETRLKRQAVPYHRLSKEEFPATSAVQLGTMHRAKGLEFKIVFVIDVAADILPAASVLGRKKDAQLRADFLTQERQLLYVSVTRARDAAFVTWAGQPSSFLQIHLNDN